MVVTISDEPPDIVLILPEPWPECLADKLLLTMLAFRTFLELITFWSHSVFEDLVLQLPSFVGQYWDIKMSMNYVEVYLILVLIKVWQVPWYNLTCKKSFLQLGLDINVIIVNKIFVWFIYVLIRSILQGLFQSFSGS